MAEEQKRELALPPGTFAYVLDSTKGVIKMYVGATVINQTGQDRPVKFNPKTFTFDECALNDARQQNIVVPEGFYAVLTNPARDKMSNKLVYPSEGQTQSTPDLSIGLKENIPGPVNFALFPGQTCEIRRGHHLRSNEYLLIKIYNEEKANENWSRAVIKIADTQTQPGQTPPTTPETTVAKSQAPKDLAVGKQYNILGTEVAFYIPPTGVSVVPEGDDDNGKAIFVRDAETLEQLEYAILVDEDGNKKYPKGPTVVFPKPTERFITDSKGNRKFRAIEMNELQGIQLKFITDGSLTYADGTKDPYKAGDEKFITGKDMPIYYPEEGHQLVKYDGKTIHYAVAIPEGEARYVMNRMTGEIRTIEGPTMLLPNPVNEIVVRRALSDYESLTWFPGFDGKGSKDALDYNRWLRQEATKEPTTRQGVVSEGRVENQSGGAGVAAAMYMNAATGFDAFDAAAMSFAAPTSSERGGGMPARKSAKSSLMAESRQGKQQDAMVGDVAERKSTFNEPRTLTFANKYKGVPTIKVQPGYAINIVDTDGSREAVVGPKTVLLEYGQALDVLSLSTGKPKSTDNKFHTSYLNVHNNKVTDVVQVETADLVNVTLKLIYNVNFDGEPFKWFTIENYVKHLCDHVRSILKGKIRKIRIEEFYANSTDILRDTILGTPGADGSKRPGLAFPENGMKVNDVEVLGAVIADAQIGQMLSQAQQQVIQQNIGLAQAKSRLEATKQQEQIFREEAEAKFDTSKRKMELEKLEVTESLSLEMSKFEAVIEKHGANLKAKGAEQHIADLLHRTALERNKETQAAAEEVAREVQVRELAAVKAQTDAIVAQMASINPALAAALESASARETLVKVARELGFHQTFGGENVADFIAKAFAGTPLQGLIDKALHGAALANGNGAAPSTSPRS